MQDGGDQSFVDATELTVNHALQDGAEASTFGHYLRVLQSYNASNKEMLLGVFSRFRDKHFLPCDMVARRGLLTARDQPIVLLHWSCGFASLKDRNSPSSQTMAMAARTMRSLSCSPSVPTAIREFATEEGNSIALTVIIYSGREEEYTSHQTSWDK